LWHVHGVDGDSDEKLLGIYSSEENAKRRIESARGLPGFADTPDGFEIATYELDGDEWLEGFEAWDGVDVPAWFARDRSRLNAEASPSDERTTGIPADGPRWDAWCEHFGAFRY
jgi:hypothetical protein